MISSTTAKAYPTGGTIATLPNWSMPAGYQIPTGLVQGLSYHPSFGLIWVAQGLGGGSASRPLLVSSLSGAFVSNLSLTTPSAIGVGYTFRSFTLNSDASMVWSHYDTNFGQGLRGYVYQGVFLGGGGIGGNGSATGAGVRAIVVEPGESFFYATQQGANSVATIDRSGTFTTFASVTSPSGLAIDPAGNIYVGAYGSNVVKITPGAVVTNYSSGTFTSPSALTYDATRNMVVVGDSSDGTVYGVLPNGSSVTLGTGAGTIAGIVAVNGTIYIYDSGGSLKSVRLSY
jgi:hypothetical protein